MTRCVAIIIVLIALLLAGHAYAGICLDSAQAVREASPGAWPSYTLRMAGHQGARCWYATTKALRHVHESEVMHNEHRGSVRSTAAGLSRYDARPRPSTPAGAIPLPRPRLERVITPHFSFEEEDAMMRQLMFGSR